MSGGEPVPRRDESICAVLPAYNEAENLPAVVGELAERRDAFPPIHDRAAAGHEGQEQARDGQVERQ